MNNRNYSGSLTREQFLFDEIRLVARLVVDGADKEEIKSKIERDNLFQYPTERLIRSKAETCLRRIEALDNEQLVQELANGSYAVAKQINLYAIMRSNTVVRDFFVYVIGEKYLTQDLSFTTLDLNVFLDELRERVPKVADWSESTVSKIKQVLKKFMLECEYINSLRSERLELVYLYPELENGIFANGDEDVFPAFNKFI